MHDHNLKFFISNTKESLAALFCLIIPICLQIQITLFSSPTYLGLRINLADALIPFVGMAILYSLLTKKSSWPLWRMPKIILWLLCLSAILIAAFFHTYFIYGEFSHWALQNKLVGWFIMLCLFGTGSWIGTNARKETIVRLLNYFLLFFALTLAIQILLSSIQVFDVIRLYFGPYKYVDYQISGLMANRNAFIFLALTAYLFATNLHLTNPKFLYPRLIYLLYALLPGLILFNASRAGIMAFFIALSGLFILHHEKKHDILKLIAVSCIFVSAYSFMFIGHARIIPLLGTIPTEIFKEISTNKDISEINQSIKYRGDKIRLTILQDTFEMIKDRPVFGSGLGSIMIAQQKKHGELINLMDSTPLWLWAETGLIGLLAFAAFYLKVVQSLWKNYINDDDFIKSVRISLLLTILGFSIMCVFHEIMYTRHLWFLLGLGLALPSKTHHHE